MGKILDKVKKSFKKAEDKAAETGTTAKDKAAETGTTAKDKAAETGKVLETGTTTASETVRKDDPLTSYTEKEPMTPAKIKEHEPTAVKREMKEKISEPGNTGANPEEAKDLARKKGMAKGLAGAEEHDK